MVFSSFILHILAMLFMLADHIWARLFSQDWLTCIGRLAFPIFAFMIAEGFFRTKNLKKYILRLLIFAVISEIPFNLIYGGSWIYPFHQNVLWTFLIAILAMVLMEKIRAKFNIIIAIVLCAVVTVVSFFLGYVLMTDYYGAGVATVLVFYFFRKRNWKHFLCQLILLLYINIEFIGGYSTPFELFGREFLFVRQSLAVLALPFIWLYNGKQGYHKKWFQYFCYVFYPLHIIVLVLLSNII